MVKDLAAVSGLLCIGAGFWLIDPAYGLIVVGLLLLVGSLIGHLRGHKVQQHGTS